GDPEVLGLGRDAAGKTLELVVPLGTQVELVVTFEHSDRGEAVELAGLKQDHAAVPLGANPLGAQPAADRGQFGGQLVAVKQRDRRELEVREEVHAGIDDIDDRSPKASMEEAFAHAAF